MSVILNRHTFGALCTLGDGSLSSPYYPGLFERPSGVAVNGGNVVGYENYPATTPDNIVKVIRAADDSLPGSYVRILTGPSGSINTTSVYAGFPPTPITGSPFSSDTRTSTPYANLFPRWTGETAWDLNAYPDTTAFTAQGIGSPGLLSYVYPGIGSAAQYGVSLNSGWLPNDPSLGGDSFYAMEAKFKIFAQSNSVCCWNEGTQIELNLEIWKVDFTATYVPGTVGYHDFTLGTPSYDSTLTQTVTVDPSWESPSFVEIGEFAISPSSSGYFYFANDFWVSSITAP